MTLNLPSLRSRVRRALLPMAAVPLLASCALSPGFEACTARLGASHEPEALLQLADWASADRPGGPCQRAYAVAVERETARRMQQAEAARASGRFADAVRGYRHVLALQPALDAALQGLRSVERQQALQQQLEEARAAWVRRDAGKARAAVDAVLAQEPGQAEALALRAEIEAQSASSAQPPGLQVALQRPVTLEFRDAPLKQLFEALSRSSGLNFVFDRDVKADQKATMLLRDTTVEQALYYVLLTNQLEYQVMNGNTVLVYPATQVKQKEYQQLNVRTFQMANADVRGVAAALRTLFKGREIVVDERQNMLVVRDTPEAIRTIEKLVALHDVAEPEVMLEVAVLEVTRKRLLNLGVQLPQALSLTPLSASGNQLTLDDLRSLSGATLGSTAPATTINARKQDTDVNILANPRIRVVNRERARVLIGDKVPVITVTTSPQGGFAESVNYVDVGLKLEVEPTIYRGTDVLIRVNLEVSSITGQTTSKLGGVAYTFGTRNATTTLRLRDGENQILAGLISDEDRRIADRLPGLGELPVLDRLLGNKDDSGSKTEIMLSITPRLVRSSSRQIMAVQEFRSGTEASPRERVTSGGEAQPAPRAGLTPAITLSQPGPGGAAQAVPAAAPALPAPAVPVAPAAAPVAAAPAPAPGTAAPAAASATSGSNWPPASGPSAGSLGLGTGLGLGGPASARAMQMDKALTPLSTDVQP